jgi:hypothetical protein
MLQEVWTPAEAKTPQRTTAVETTGTQQMTLMRRKVRPKTRLMMMRRKVRPKMSRKQPS